MILRIHGKTLVSDGYNLPSKSYLTVWMSLTWLHYLLFLQEATSFTKVARDVRGAKRRVQKEEVLLPIEHLEPQQASFARVDLTVMGFRSPRNTCDGADFSVGWTSLIQRPELWSTPQWTTSQAKTWSKWKSLTAQNFIPCAKPLKIRPVWWLLHVIPALKRLRW